MPTERMLATHTTLLASGGHGFDAASWRAGCGIGSGIRRGPSGCRKRIVNRATVARVTLFFLVLPTAMRCQSARGGVDGLVDPRGMVTWVGPDRPRFFGPEKAV